MCWRGKEAEEDKAYQAFLRQRRRTPLQLQLLLRLRDQPRYSAAARVELPSRMPSSARLVLRWQVRKMKRKKEECGRERESRRAKERRERRECCDDRGSVSKGSAESEREGSAGAEIVLSSLSSLSLAAKSLRPASRSSRREVRRGGDYNMQ